MGNPEFEKKVIEELNFIKKQIGEIREHMVDVDTILTWEEKELLEASFRNEDEGKLKTLEKLEEELGLKKSHDSDIFEIFLDTYPQIFLKKAGLYTDYRTMEIIKKLTTDPVPAGTKRILDSMEELFRLRAEHYRFLYRVNFEKKQIIVLKVEHIKRTYR